MLNFTPIARWLLRGKARKARRAFLSPVESQIRQLRWLLYNAADTQIGREHHFEDILSLEDPRRAFVDLLYANDYEYFRPFVNRMMDGENDVLWPGVCKDFAQSSGTSGGASKYIPITRASLHLNHYRGASESVALYLDSFPDSRLFSGKGFILGGSFATKARPRNPKAKVGDLSATLINRIYPLANLFRVPDKKSALMQDWHVKLHLLARKAVKRNITNISGVPSWFMKVLEHALHITGKNNLREIWPDMEVFFHGGINFEPYREEYARLFGTPPRYWENYNASEGFFACQSEPDGPLTLLTDAAVYYEFLPLGADPEDPSQLKLIEELQPGQTYELIISAPNGLFRYRIGDTIRIEGVNPVTFRIAGRTKAYINAFGEEIMEDNAERAIAKACKFTHSAIYNYTAAPQYAEGHKKGRHRWLIEFTTPPEDLGEFAFFLDDALTELNSDYDAKRTDDIFLDPPEVIEAPRGTFDRWLSHAGSGKLGGQRKIPRLSNDPLLLDTLLDEIKENEKD